MAKKNAPQKKKAAAPKAKPVKTVKAAKPLKSKAKPALASKAKKATVKSVKPLVKSASKSAKAAVPAVPQPDILSKKTKAPRTVASGIPVETPKVRKNIVSLVEVEPSAEDSGKAEKVSKVKPVKVDRGNLADEKAKWAELFKKYGKEKAQVYKMTDTYPSLVPLQHKVLGWGFILTNENDRLEVLFENGIRMLISNYKH